MTFLKVICQALVIMECTGTCPSDAKAQQHDKYRCESHLGLDSDFFQLLSDFVIPTCSKNSAESWYADTMAFAIFFLRWGLNKLAFLS